MYVCLNSIKHVSLQSVINDGVAQRVVVRRVSHNFEFQISQRVCQIKIANSGVQKFTFSYLRCLKCESDVPFFAVVYRPERTCCDAAQDWSKVLVGGGT